MKYILPILLTLLVSCSGQSTKNSKSSNSEGSKSMKQSEQAASVAQKAVCKLNSDERTIIQQNSENGGCSVNYTKFGETNPVASAQYDTAHCSNIFDRIRANLEKNGFVCE